MGPGVRRDDERVLLGDNEKFYFGTTRAFDRGRRRVLRMTIADKLVLQRQHHLKWRSFDRLELILMILCGVLCFGFSLSVTADIVTRTIGRPWLWLQEVTSTFFMYGAVIGAAVATRRQDHLNLSALSEALVGRTRTVLETLKGLVVLGVACWMVGFGYLNFLNG